MHNLIYCVPLAESTGANAGFALAVIAFVGMGLYFVPTVIGYRRNHPNLAPIMIINLLLGWTLIGWVVSLAWASTAIKAKN